MRTIWCLFILFSVLFILAGCGEETLEPQVETDVIISQLQQDGINPKAVGPSQMAWLQAAPGTAYQLTNDLTRERLYIHTYIDEHMAKNVGSRIEKQLEIGMINWGNTPHFFQCSHLMILYLGTNDSVLSVLTDTCGPEIKPRIRLIDRLSDWIWP